MDLNKLFKLFREKKLHYVDVSTNENGYFRAFASSVYNGRGDAIDIVIGDVEAEYLTEIAVRLLRRGEDVIEKKVLSEDIAFELIENF
jgi:hypothetical protein